VCERKREKDDNGAGKEYNSDGDDGNDDDDDDDADDG